jgi:hypothetical protein
LAGIPHAQVGLRIDAHDADAVLRRGGDGAHCRAVVLAVRLVEPLLVEDGRVRAARELGMRHVEPRVDHRQRLAGPRRRHAVGADLRPPPLELAQLVRLRGEQLELAVRLDVLQPAPREQSREDAHRVRCAQAPDVEAPRDERRTGRRGDAALELEQRVVVAAELEEPRALGRGQRGAPGRRARRGDERHRRGEDDGRCLQARKGSPSTLAR